MIDPKYEILIADLSSLYEDHVHPPVFAEDCLTYEQAVKAKSEWQDSVTAAWIQDKNTGRIIP